MTQTEQACVEAMEIISQSQRTPSSSRVLCQKNLQRSIKKKNSRYNKPQSKRKGLIKLTRSNNVIILGSVERRGEKRKEEMHASFKIFSNASPTLVTNSCGTWFPSISNSA
jgi:hypothetical protein